MFTGANSREELQATLEEVNILLHTAGFPLIKWAANDAELLENIDPNKIDTCSQIGFDDKSLVKALGIYWILCDDTLKIWFERL